MRLTRWAFRRCGLGLIAIVLAGCAFPFPRTDWADRRHGRPGEGVTGTASFVGATTSGTHADGAQLWESPAATSGGPETELTPSITSDVPGQATPDSPDGTDTWEPMLDDLEQVIGEVIISLDGTDTLEDVPELFR